jgi:hypothetical protein
MAHYGIGRHSTPNVNIDAVGGLAAARLGEPQPSEVESTADLLDRLGRGEISRDVYLDLRVEEAIAPFARNLGNNQIEFMRVALRDQLESDPVLIDLVKRATELASAR